MVKNARQRKIGTRIAEIGSDEESLLLLPWMGIEHAKKESQRDRNMSYFSQRPTGYCKCVTS